MATHHQEAQMAQVVLTAQVEDGEEWEAGFRTHGDLFRAQTIPVMHFTVNEDNMVAIYCEPSDLDAFMEVLESPATADAMEFDGVIRETVQVFVLDREFEI
jgi:hypothetical protein